MTPAEWDTLPDPLRLLAAVRQPDARKLRLLDVAACRRAVERFRLPHADLIINAAERFADGIAAPGELDAAHQEALWLNQYTHISPGKRLTAAALLELTYVVQHPGRCVDLCRRAVRQESEFADLVREVFGHPFRPVPFDPRWRTAAAVGLAATAYDTGDFTLLPILADALEEAGCAAADLLAHCRDPGLAHVRGCWAVDLVLGKG